MNDFCGSEFWNFTKLWADENPDFTPCFEQTVLVYVPCGFLWIFTLLELWYLKTSYLKNVPWSFWNISKLVGILALIILSTIDIIMAGSYNRREETDGLIWPVHFVTPAVKIVSFALAGVLVYLNKVRGQVCSGLLWLFWFLLAVFAIPQMRTEAMAMGLDGQEENAYVTYQRTSFIIFFCITWLVFLISCFADTMPRESKYEKQANPNPEYLAGFLSRLTFSYYDKYAWMGYRRPLMERDMWDLRYEDTAREINPEFQKHYQESVKKVQKLNQLAALENVKHDANGYQNGYQMKPPKKDKKDKDDEKDDKSKPEPGSQKKEASIVPAMFKCYGATFFFGSILLLIQTLLIFVNPKILDRIIYFALPISADTPIWKGIFYAFALFVVTSVSTVVENQHFNRMFFVGMRIRTALISAIYRKSLRLSNAARRKETVGEIVNLMSVDCQRFIEVTIYISLIWAAPLQIGLALYFLWEYLGWATLVGLAAMIVLLPFNGILAKKSQDLQVKQMKFKDERVKMMNEVLNGIKVLKLYAWEPSFEKRILQVRDKEIKALRSAAYLGAGFSFIWTSAPFLVALVSFATYVLSDPEHVLDPQRAFVSLSLFNILRAPFAMLPMMVTSLVQTIVSIRRINRFMNSDELDPDVVEHDPKETSALVIENGTFRWDEESTTLKDINMRVETGQLVAVVGSVGCGKSSLISVLLGDIEKVSGRVNQLGSVAYVAQQAWIQNATLKDNILFGKQFDRQRYEAVIEACALKPDLAMLPAGDLTEIGEKGINLSGGQKQRVSLARAVYQNADVYYLDDPLSAVDSHVGKHIFEQVVSNDGLLAGKTRLLVTHGITYLPKVDNIFVMSYGEITESGNYRELLAKKGAFADFLLEHIKDAGNDESEDLAEIKAQLEKEIADSELRAKLERAISTASDRRDSISSTGSTESLKGSRRSITASSTELRKRKSSVKKEEDAKGDTLIEEERAEIGGVKLEVYKYYMRNIGWGICITTLIMQILYQGTNVGSSLWLSQWSTDYRAAEPGRRNMYLTGYGLFGLGQATFSMIGALFFKTGAVAAAALIHAWLLNNMLKYPMSFFDTTPLGRILARFSSDIAAVDIMIPILIELFFLMGLGVVSTVIVICISTPWFMTVVVPISFLYLVIQRIYIATSRQLKRLESVTRSPIYSHFGETLTGTSTIRAYNAETRFIETSDVRVDKNQVCYFPSIVAARWLSLRLQMIGNLITFFAALFAVLGRNSESTINAGLVGLSVSYAMGITQVLNWLVRMASDVETNIVAVERIKEYGESKQEAPWNLPNENTPKGWPNTGEVEFIDYQTRYREGLELVLQGVSFKVSGGEKIGIVGRTGAGKSSMTLGLFRIIEAAGGQILIDGIDISKIGLHTLRSRLTIIPQDPILFSGTLRLNLDPGDIHTDDEVWEALENAHLKAFVKGLPSGLSHEISEGGENLSVGQRQLVCLARALLRKTKVLILDEATAAVDLETDDLIQKTIRTEFKECTVLTIAHRLNTILDSTKVLVLDKGHVAEFAPPDELLQDKNSIFYGMAKDAGIVS